MLRKAQSPHQKWQYILNAHLLKCYAFTQLKKILNITSQIELTASQTEPKAVSFVMSQCQDALFNTWNAAHTFSGWEKVPALQGVLGSQSLTV